MHRSWFIARYNEIWSVLDLGCPKGHGLRIRSTTHLLFLGVDPFIVIVQGGWKSTTLEYWCDCEESVPILLVSLYPQSLCSLEHVLFQISLIKCLVILHLYLWGISLVMTVCQY